MYIHDISDIWNVSRFKSKFLFIGSEKRIAKNWIPLVWLSKQSLFRCISKVFNNSHYLELQWDISFEMPYNSYKNVPAIFYKMFA